jgi:ubiquinone/menaquinone biosynthesis C-methylase UbiE
VTGETDAQRRRRRYQRALFDGVAQLYQASRLGYSREIVEFIAATAAVSDGSTVLEVGCGTGQLTESLADSGLNLTAIDIGPAMIAAARHRLDGSGVSFQVTSFEDFTAAESSIDLIISGAAFHWVDPEVKFSKSARLLRPGGWLAVVDAAERYDDPFGATLRDMWLTYCDSDGAWVNQDLRTAAITDTGLFEEPVYRLDERRMTRPVALVIGLENTRATSLSWPDDVRRRFTARLRHELRWQAEVPFTQSATLTMARVPQA